MNRDGVFISHIHEENAVALVLQKHLKYAFGTDFPVFVSSDPVSIGGGRKWFEYILNSLRQQRVALILVSHESRGREWINFEAGLAEGCGITVIPVAIRNFVLADLSFPLLGFNGRRSEDIEGILLDIERETHFTPRQVDRLEFMKDLRAAEFSIDYKSLVITSYLTGKNKAEFLRFEIENRGNVDIDLLFFELIIPLSLLNPIKLSVMYDDVVLLRDLVIDPETNEQCYRVRYTSALGGNQRRLEPILTRSMGIRQLSQPVYAISLDKEEAMDEVIRYQLFARDYDTTQEVKRVKQLDVRLIPS